MKHIKLYKKFESLEKDTLLEIVDIIDNLGDDLDLEKLTELTDTQAAYINSRSIYKFLITEFPSDYGMEYINDNNLKGAYSVELKGSLIFVAIKLENKFSYFRKTYIQESISEFEIRLKEICGPNESMFNIFRDFRKGKWMGNVVDESYNYTITINN